MRIEFAADLVEDAVFLEVLRREKAGDRQEIRAYRAKVDPLYEKESDQEERNIQFQDVHEEFFRKLGLEQRLFGLIAEFSALHTGLAAIIFVKASSRKEEGAELFVQPEKNEAEGRTAVVKLRAELLLEIEDLALVLRKELAHISDMVDPAFGYEPSLGETGEDIARENLIRDRYSLLWQVYVDARLQRQGKLSKNVLDVHRKMIRRAFASHKSSEAYKLLNKVWGSSKLKHSDLLNLACV